MQANGGLIQHVEHTSQAGADLRGKANALRLTTGKRSGRAGQGEVVQANVDKKVQTRLNLAQHGTCNHFLAVAQDEVVQVLRGVLNRKLSQTGDGFLAMRRGGKPHRQNFRLEAGAFTGWARHLTGVGQQTVLLRICLGLLHLALDVAHHTFVGGGVGTLAAVTVLVSHVHLGWRAMHQVLLLRLGQRAQRRVRIKALFLRQCLNQFGEVPFVRAGVPDLERIHRRRIRVRNHQVNVHFLAHAKTVAHRAGTER